MPPPKRLYRDPSGPIGGVAGGFAGYFDVDPVIPRLLWIVALFSGIGLPAYVVCWLVIPKAKVWPPPGYGTLPAGAAYPNQTALLSGLVILGLVAVVATGADGLAQYLLPAALVGVGVYLLSQRNAAATARAASVQPQGEASRAVASAALATEQATWEATSAPRPSRPGLVTPTVLSLLAIGAGVLVAIDAAGVSDVSVGAVAAGGLIIVGGGLLASLWFGRARGLVPLGLGLVSIMLVAPKVESWTDQAHVLAALADDDDDNSSAPDSKAAGKVAHAPQALEELQPSYELAAGELTLDLSALDFSQVSREVKVDLGLGQLLVIVGQDAPVEVRADVGMGEARALDNTQKGMGVSLRANAAPPNTTGKLLLDLDVGMGKLEVRRGL